MKKNATFPMRALVLLALCVFTLCMNSCGKKPAETENKTDEKPLNISIYLDLSDRLTRQMTPSQKDKDIAIVDNLLNYFTNNCVENKILQSKNRLRVIFHPSPSSSKIATQADELEIDMGELKGAEKKKALLELKPTFDANLSDIYEATLLDQKWIGSDVWDFFSSKKVDIQCLKQGYRNILVILTDGYLYQENNKRQEGSAYSYVLPQTLQDPNSSLICQRKGLKDLEVLMLEVNPYNPKQKDKLTGVLEDWFKGMEVKSFVVAETDLPSNTKQVIDSFLN